MCVSACSPFFFFQAEDGIRDTSVTGVQTCALPISQSLRFSNYEVHFIANPELRSRLLEVLRRAGLVPPRRFHQPVNELKIGRASCRERVCASGVAGRLLRE